MSNYQFSSDLVNDVLFRADEPIDGTSDFQSKAVEYINRAYQAIWTGGAELDPSINEDWWWLRKDPPGVLTIEPKIVAGTASVTNNSTAIEFSSSPAKDLDDWFFKVDDEPDVFRISAHTAAASGATLDAVFTGDTATAASYKVFKLEYTLATDALKVVGPMRVYQDGRKSVDGVSLSSLDARYPIASANGGTPDEFANVTEQKVRFNRYGGATGTELIRAEYDYMRVPAALTSGAAEEPAVPLQYRRIIADYGAALLHEDKDDDRSKTAAALAKSGLKAMEVENRARLTQYSRNMGKIIPRQSMAAENIGPLRTSAGLIIG